MTTPTVIRSVVHLEVESPAVASVAVAGAWGLILWHDIDDTFPTDPPGPFTRPDLSWMAHGYFYKGPAGGVVTRLHEGQPVYDIRSQRQMPAPSGVLFCLATSIDSAATVHWFARLPCPLTGCSLPGCSGA